MSKITVQQKAVSAALKGNWDLALQLNKLLVKSNKSDVDALNRLARAYSELGKIAKAKSTSAKVLKLDPSNQIAAKSLEKFKKLKSGNNITKTKPSGVSNMFLEEPGKTKILKLLHIGDEKVLATLDAGNIVKISCKKHRVSILTDSNKYVGRLPDDLASRIKKLIKIGNKYITLIKNANSKEVYVFIREVERSPKMHDIATFSTERIDYVSFTPPELVHGKKPMADVNT